MPRIPLSAHNLEDIEALEEHEHWEAMIGRNPADGRYDNRQPDARGERRFNGAEALARKRADRRKHIARAQRRV
ncbi:MAG TPA: hypothetical protein PKK78_00930 [Kouleothrix sp.]|jgi:hypothetical protein|nr:hypothetical protein [Kouleothrix sp.]